MRAKNSQYTTSARAIVATNRKMVAAQDKVNRTETSAFVQALLQGDAVCAKAVKVSAKTDTPTTLKDERAALTKAALALVPTKAGKASLSSWMSQVFRVVKACPRQTKSWVRGGYGRPYTVGALLKQMLAGKGRKTKAGAKAKRSPVQGINRFLRANSIRTKDISSVIETLSLIALQAKQAKVSSRKVLSVRALKDGTLKVGTVA